jgi:type IV pilus assembly protein PilC
MLEKFLNSYIDYQEKSWFGTKQKLLFFRELWYLLWGWVGINDAITIIAKNGDTGAQRYIGQMVLASINEGKTLTNSLARTGNYFPPSDIAIIKAGETSGNLVPVLRNLAKEYAFINTLTSKFIGAVTYPVVLLVIAIVAVFVLFIGILPGIFSIALQFKWVELPPVTRFMMRLSDAMRHNLWSIMIGFGLFFFFCSIIMSSESGKAKAFRLLLQVPGFGILVRNYYIVKFMRYLKLLQQSWLNYIESLQLLDSIMGVGVYKEMIQAMIAHVQRGEQMYIGIQAYPHLIPTNASMLMKVGEETAQLPETLQNITDGYEEDLMTRIGSISKIIEPILIVFLWVVIVLIALSVFGIITTVLWGVWAQ